MNNEILPEEMRRVISRRRFLEYVAFGTSLMALPLSIKAEDKHYLIVGAGIVGTAIAYALAGSFLWCFARKMCEKWLDIKNMN